MIAKNSAMWLDQVYDLAQYVSTNLKCIHPDLPPKIGGIVVTAAVTYLIIHGYHRYKIRCRIHDRGEMARAAIQNLEKLLEKEGQADPEMDSVIVSLSFKDLQWKLQKGELKAVDVLKAYQRKALEVNRRLNCLVEPIWEANAIAVELDLLKPNQRKPLHGIPVSLKENLYVEGYDSSAGLHDFAFAVIDHDSDIVQILKSQGAVPFVRTNVPQTLISFACSNPMFGRTCNPHDPTRGPGGSSGGEGALIASGGSLLGFGSDVGGSIRIPTQMCGIYGLKPTAGRVGSRGICPIISGQTLVKDTVGPLARDMDGLIEVTRSILMQKMYILDPYIPPVPFRDELFEKTGIMRIGYYTSMGGMEPHPTCVRAVTEAKYALEHLGHKVVEFEPPHGFQAFCDLYLLAVFGDNFKVIGKHLDNDVLDVSCARSYYLIKIPSFLKKILGILFQLWDPALGQMLLSGTKTPKNVIQWWSLEEKIQNYKEEFLKIWQMKRLDAVIGPGVPFPAVTSDYECELPGGLSYTCLYNLINYPAGYLPVTKVTEDDISLLKDPKVYHLNGSMEKFILKDSKGTVGLPMGVQCAALPFQEEVVLRVMREIDKAIN